MKQLLQMMAVAMLILFYQIPGYCQNNIGRTDPAFAKRVMAFQTPDTITDLGKNSKSNPQSAPLFYCGASGGCSEHISRVQAGAFDNITTCSNYESYTSPLYTIYLPRNQSLPITITNGAPYSGDQCGIWVDWNADSDFEDPNETIALSVTPGLGPYTATLLPPVGAGEGLRTMRIRITWTGLLSPCGTTTYGEVEDYTIYVTEPGVNYWVGGGDQNWHNPANWSLNTVPTSTQSVKIPGLVIRSPMISNNAECKDLEVEHGVEHNAGSLSVYGDFNDTWGNYVMSGSATLIFAGTEDADWYVPGPTSHITNVIITKSTLATLSVSSYAGIINNTLDIRGGILRLSAYDHLTVGNSVSSPALTVQSNTSPLYNGSLQLDSYSTLTIVGSLTLQEKSNVELNNATLYCSGDFVFNNDAGYNISLSGGDFYFQGTKENQYLLQTNLATLTFGDVFIDKVNNSNKLYLSNKNMKIAGNLEIISGALSCGNGPTTVAWYNINIGGNWTNQNFPNGFLPGSGKVIFDGAGIQNISSSENFNILEVNRTSALRINTAGTNVSCNSYNWISGGLEVQNGANFTAFDLAQQGLFGSYRVSSGSTMNLYQDNIQWVDLDADVYFDGGGTINVYGGNGDSWWAFSRNASLTMNGGGNLDFKNNGITISNSSYSLSSSLSGNALIRTSGGLNFSRTGFAPASGTFEMYGTSDRNISLGSTNSLPNLIINKGAKGEEDDDMQAAMYDPRGGHLLTDGSKANMATMVSNVNISGQLNVLSGKLRMGSYKCTVTGVANIYGSLEMTSASNEFTASTLTWRTGSAATVSAGKFFTQLWVFEPAAFINIGIGNTAYVSSGLAGQEPTASFGNLVTGSSSKGDEGDVSKDEGGRASRRINVSGNYTHQGTPFFYFIDQDLHVTGNANLAAGCNLLISTNSLFSITGDLNIIGKLSVISNGSVNLQGGLSLPASGTLHIFTGTFTHSNPVLGWNIISGSITMLGNGLIDFVNKGILLMNSAATIITAGTIRCTNSFTAFEAPNFKPTGGTVEITGCDPYITCYNSNWFHNLKINQSGDECKAIVDNMGNPLIIKNNIEFVRGRLDVQNPLFGSQSDIYVGGNWMNPSGTNWFDAGTGLVAFNGTGDQTVEGYVKFYDLTNSKPTGSLVFNGNIAVRNDFVAAGNNIVNGPSFHLDELLNLTSGTITINSSGGITSVFTNNFTTGGHLIMNNGTFACNDLTQAGIFGSVTMNDGTIHLKQDDFNYPDINGNVTIHGGLMKVEGGADASWWSKSGNAMVEMTGGTLDCINNGIIVGDSPYSFSQNITGGLIRTNTFIAVDRPGFDPPGGTLELYGNGFSMIQTVVGSFNDLVISKTFDKSPALKTKPRKPLNLDRGSRSYQVYTLSDITVRGNFTVNSGELLVGENLASLQQNIYIHNNINVNDEALITMNPGAAFFMGNGSQFDVNTGGALRISGSEEKPVLLSRISTGYYTLNVHEEAEIGVERGVFEYMTGINALPGALIDPGSPFHYSTFRNGQPGGYLLNFHNVNDLLVLGAQFPDNTWGGMNNMVKNNNDGFITFLYYTGDFGGSAFESDPWSRVNWYTSMPVNNLSLPAGWSGLSSYNMPSNSDIVNVFTPVNSSLIIAQTMTGAYYPAGGMNTIGNWSSQSAYKVKMSSPAILSITGLPETNKILNLTSGWNLVPVIANTPVDVASLFSGTELMIVKDVAGVGVYWPAMGINTIGNLLPGSAYYALMNAPGTVIFPVSSKEGWSGEFPNVKHPVHPWNKVNVSPSSHLIAIEASGMNGLLQGDVIGIFSQTGECFGITEISSTSANTFITAYADDATTGAKDGFVEMEQMTYKVFRPSTEEVFDVEVEYNQQLPQTGKFADEGLSAIKMMKFSSTGLASEFSSNINIYPNPNVGLVWISGISEISKIELISVLGTIVKTITNDGQNEQNIDLSDLQPGVYQVKLTDEKGNRMKQIVKN